MTSRAGRRVILALAAGVVSAGALSLFRPGYTPDEEFTLFAVRGVQAHGLPLLPSGLLYDRGLAYSYLSWLAATLTGLELPAFRTLSLLSAAGTLLVGYALLRRLLSPAAGVVAASLVALSLPFWAAATTGRFYMPFVLASVGILAAIGRTRAHPSAPVGTRPQLPAPVHTWLPLLALAFLSRLLHELAFTLMALPVGGVVLERVDDRLSRTGWRGSVPVGLVLLAGLGASQTVLFALHYFQPPPGSSGDTMIQRFFLWQVLNLFERPTGAPLGVIAAVVVVAWLLAPHRATRALGLGLAAAAVVLAIEATRAAVMGPLADGWFPRLVGDGLSYPLDMLWHLARTHPLTLATALVLIVARRLEAGGEWHACERAAHLGWVGWVLWFGVIESGITLNYVLLPTVCLLAAIGIDMVAIAEHTRALWPGRRAQVIRTALACVAVLVAIDQWPGTGSPAQRLSAARPTIRIESIDDVRTRLRPDDLVACTDELACLLLVGRADAWLALDDYVRERFVVQRGSSRTGVYAGAPAALTLRELFELAPARGAGGRIIVVDVFKEYPVGNSITWLPRALDAERVHGETLLSTQQARIVQIRDRR